MSLISLRLLAQRAIFGLFTVMNAHAMPTATTSPYESLVPREFTLADGTKSVIYENRAVQFITERSAASPAIDRRLSYQSYTPPNGRNDYCGESDPRLSFPANAALAADCFAIADAYTESTLTGGVRAYWIVTANDFTSAPGGQVVLAAHGSCKFPIRLNDNVKPQTVYFGANDLRFYIRGAAQKAQQGRIEALGSVSCNNNTDGFFVSVEYRVTHT